ncbi:MAG TPA: DUF1659 domain-containing protein [Clostridiales bacterium]|nr:DUF1659 domain-containing protein [Clostridiales bacterium]
MAVEARPLNSTLQLTYDMGTDQEGKALSRRRSYSNVKVDAADQDVFDVAAVIYGLQTYPMSQIQVTDRKHLVNAE